MSTHLALTTFLVPDYDSAIAFFTRVLGMALVEDTDLGGGKRWVVVGGAVGGRLLLARATSDSQGLGWEIRPVGELPFSCTLPTCQGWLHALGRKV